MRSAITRFTATVPAFANSNRFFLFWQGEAIRLRETHQGPLDDRAACHQALKQPADAELRVLCRADALARQTGLQNFMHLWASRARWMMLLLLALSFVAGTATTAAALGSSYRPINLAMVLLALLGLNILSFVLWLLSLLSRMTASTSLSQLWLWLTRHVTRGADGPLAVQALLSLLARTRALKPALGLISHASWLSATLAMIVTLLLMFSTRSYTFHWETTLLTPASFVWLTKAIGFLPGLLGFPLPNEAAIAASLNGQIASATIQANWSIWLIGCMVGWGLLPRLLAALACGVLLHRRLGGLHIDMHLPGWTELHGRLLPQHRNLGIDRPAPAPRTTAPARYHASAPGSGARAVLAHELGKDIVWPPDGLPPDVRDLGNADSRSQRQELRLWLANHPDLALLVICDSRITPDRGTRQWFAELQQLCPHIAILCLADDSNGRGAIWRTFLHDLGIEQVTDLSHWLQRGELHA